MKKLAILFVTAFALTGCASNDWAHYASAQKSIAEAEAAKEIARYQALATIAQNGDTTAKAVAAMSIQAGTAASRPTQLATPVSTEERIRSWLGIIVPGVVQGYAVNRNAQVAITQSNNSAAVAQSTNSAFVGIASQIQAPGAVTTTTTNYTSSFNDSTTPQQVVNPVVVDPVVVQPTAP